MEISLKSKNEIFKLIISSNTNFLDNSDNDLEFLKQIWDIRNMPSEDNRFSNAEGDIWQHTVNNNDWDLEYLFIDRLKLNDDNDIFKKFIETTISPNFRTNEEDILFYVASINDILENDDLKLSIFDYNTNGLPIYKTFIKSDVEDIPIDIKKNDIIFLVSKNTDQFNQFNQLKNINNEYLYVDIKYENNTLVLDYKLENNNGIAAELFTLIESHYSELKLLQRFSDSADMVITPLKNDCYLFNWY